MPPGSLDRYLGEKPNIQTVALEDLLLFTNNQISQWLRHKSDQEREGPCSAIRATPEFARLSRLKGKLRQKLKNVTSCSLRGAESNGLGPRKLRRSLPT